METVAVLAHFEFKAGKVAAAQQFFDNGKLTVEDQPTSTRWWAFRIGPNTFGAFAVFASKADREALLSSGGPRASQANAELFETAPSFQKVDILAAREGY
ncbi:MAG: antibiotic biosynthesis monooxygenase [Pseudonocardiales bacterium]|nr:MAG: antibiotic biosynthesis monooxygenase [Pseudonocardiales bacterium]